MGICPSRDLSSLDSPRYKTEVPEENLELFEGNFHLADMVFENDAKALSKYKQREILGRGAFGEVMVAECERTGMEFALKKIKKPNKIMMSEEDFKEIARLKKEVKILKSLDHPNIIKVFDYFQDSSSYYIMMEYCKGGDLEERIEHYGAFFEEYAASIMKQIFSAVNYCHTNQVIHRDLKPNNILFESEGDNIVKLADFGCSALHDEDGTAKTTEGTLFYAAPEIFYDSSYDEKCDMWSLGVILYEILTGRRPFEGTEDEVIEMLKTGEYSFDEKDEKSISHEAKDLISKLLRHTPADRLTCEQALRSDWILRKAKHEKLETIPLAREALQTMMDFKPQKRTIKAVASLYIANHLTDKAKRIKLQKVFKELDKDANGTIDLEELIKGYHALFESDISDSQIVVIFNNVDINNSGEVDFSEFLAATQEEQCLFLEKNLQDLFNRFDHDGDGFIERIELLKVIGHYLDKDCGKLSYDQFRQEMLQH
eukprot:CAMPEP_0115007154 /NCGR_PEP_ID=MMETSP0216-20121206/20977_1 /TAXON_ID=223996 /ORGANISM="Protocruzia adherens, Strain Boccale" /LENGTH=484 /DNA_ID=CAMNT_0002373975 /DNA_START=278 /DNA_END=1732 /DNA_ORIENTATION=+